MDFNLFKNKELSQFVKYLVLIFLIIYGGILASVWLDDYLTGLQGGQVLQGGTFWKALTITFRDAANPDRKIPVDNISFRNVDRFLPIAVIVHIAGRDSTYYSGIQEEQVHVVGTGIDSLVIRTRNASHSVVIDDLSFQMGGRRYEIDFDRSPQDVSIPPNTQLLDYRIDGLMISFGADNAVPTVVRGIDLGEVIGRYFSEFSGPFSTALILVLIALPFWMIFRFAHAMGGGELSLERFFSEQDVEAIRRHKMEVFWGGRFSPEGKGYAFKEDTELNKILSSVGPDTASDSTRLVEHCTDKVYMLFDEIEDRLSETFGMVGLLALSLGLLGTVLGMINAFTVLEDSMKIGEGPAQTQLKMAHYINFALVTTAIGFIGRVLSILLVRKIKSRAIQDRTVMIDIVQHFDAPVNNAEEIHLTAASSERRS